MLPNLSSLTVEDLEGQKNSPPSLNFQTLPPDQQQEDIGVKRDRDGNYVLKQKQSSTKYDIQKIPNFKDSLSTRMKRLPYIENYPQNGNWGENYSKYIKNIQGVNLKLRIGYDNSEAKGFMLKAGAPFEAGEFICIVSGIYCSREMHGSMSDNALSKLDNYNFKVANVVKGSELLRLSEKINSGSQGAEAGNSNAKKVLQEATLFKDLKMTDVLLCPRLQTTFFEGTSPGETPPYGTYILVPPGVYEEGDTNVPLMWDPYAPSPAKEGEFLKGVLDVGFLANRPEEPNDVNATVKPFLVKAKKTERKYEDFTRLVFAMFATTQIEEGSEILIDYGYEMDDHTDDDTKKDTRVTKDSVDDYAIFSKCLRQPGMQTLQDNPTSFYTSTDKSKTCVFFWPDWEESWKKNRPFASQCGPKVVALQVGVSKSFSVLAASLNDDALALNREQLGTKAGNNWLEAVIINGGQYVSVDVISPPNLKDNLKTSWVPRYRSSIPKALRDMRAKEFEEIVMDGLKDTITDLEKLSRESNDAYQASTSPELPQKAQERRDSLLDLYAEIDILAHSLLNSSFITSNELRDASKLVVKCVLNTDQFLNSLVGCGPILTPETFGSVKEILDWWSTAETSANVNNLTNKYKRYLALHAKFFDSSTNGDLLECWKNNVEDFRYNFDQHQPTPTITEPTRDEKDVTTRNSTESDDM